MSKGQHAPTNAYKRRRRRVFHIVVQEGEMANWLAGARAKRPFDICAQTPPDPEAQQGHIGNRPEWIGYDIGVADPTRVGRLPAGTPYYQKGRASYRLQNRKNSKYRSDVRYFGPITKTVGYVPLVFECSGGFGPTATEDFCPGAPGPLPRNSPQG